MNTRLSDRSRSNAVAPFNRIHRSAAMRFQRKCNVPWSRPLQDGRMAKTPPDRRNALRWTSCLVSAVSGLC